MSSGVQGGKAVLARAALAFLLMGGGLAGAEQTVEVVVQNYRYQPQVVRIRVGDTVRWVNREKRTSHSVVFAVEQGGESERFFPMRAGSAALTRPVVTHTTAGRIRR